LKDPGIDGRITLKSIFENQNGMAYARFMWPGAGSKCWALVNMTSNLRVK
jgi:hypothetical protein